MNKIVPISIFSVAFYMMLTTSPFFFAEKTVNDSVYQGLFELYVIPQLEHFATKHFISAGWCSTSLDMFYM